MFLSGGGVYAHADPRRTSIAAALDVAAGGGLQGVILNTLALQAAPGAVADAAARGLRVRRCSPVLPLPLPLLLPPP